MAWLEVLVEVLAAFVFIIGQLLPYIPQYVQMTQTKDSSGFSRNVPLVIISANLMRLLFWLGKPFGLVLVVQSFVMIATQLFLLHTCVQYNSNPISPRPLWKDFGAWRCMLTYCDIHIDAYLACFWAIATFLTALLYPNKVYFEVLGCCALFTEASLAVPQLIQNAMNHSTVGLSSLMVWGWAIGDGMKTSYFLAKSEPIQFVAGGMMQVTVDILILGQMWIYARDKHGERNNEEVKR